eukprot:367296-Amphidinium_carterae.1
MHWGVRCVNAAVRLPKKTKLAKPKLQAARGLKEDGSGMTEHQDSVKRVCKFGMRVKRPFAYRLVHVAPHKNFGDSSLKVVFPSLQE